MAKNIKKCEVIIFIRSSVMNDIDATTKQKFLPLSHFINFINPEFVAFFTLIAPHVLLRSCIYSLSSRYVLNSIAIVIYTKPQSVWIIQKPSRTGWKRQRIPILWLIISFMKSFVMLYDI